MRFAMVVAVLSGLAMAMVGGARAGSYVTGVLVEKLNIYLEDNGTKPVYIVDADKVAEPITVNSEDGDWVEIVVDGEYYWVRRSDVQLSREQVAGAPMKAAAGQGARLGFGGN